MAALSITAASVAISANGSTRRREGISGEAITQGQAVALDPADGNRVVKTVATDADLHKCCGIALNTVAAAGLPVDYLVYDEAFTPGATLVAGKVYIIGAVAGTIHPVADSVATWYGCIVGVANSTSTMKVNFTAASYGGVAI